MLSDQKPHTDSLSLTKCSADRPSGIRPAFETRIPGKREPAKHWCRYLLCTQLYHYIDVFVGRIMSHSDGRIEE